MTNEELDAVIKRLDLEKRYEKATADNDGGEAAKNWIKETFKSTASDLGKQTVKYAGAKLINKILKEEAVYANNKKK